MPDPPPNGVAPVGDADAWVALLRAVADATRLRIIHLLEQPCEPGLTVGELADVLKLPQSTVSRHLKTLTDFGITSVRRDGTSMFYRLAAQASEPMLAALRNMSRPHMDRDRRGRSDMERLNRVLRRRADKAETFFDQAARDWDNIRRQWFGEAFQLEALLALANPTWTVGDLGSGTGVMLSLLAPHVRMIMAVEPVAAMRRVAAQRVQREKLTNVKVLAGTLEKLPLPNRSLDVALVILVLHHVIDPAAALAETARALKPGGLLLLVDLQPHGIEEFRAGMGHRWMGFDAAQIRGWLAAAGFAEPRWHPLAAAKARDPRGSMEVPDLFVMRAVRDGAPKA